MFFCVYWAMSGVADVGSRASWGQIGASRASECRGSFDLRRSSLSPLLDQSVRALEAWPLYAG